MVERKVTPKVMIRVWCDKELIKLTPSEG